MITSHGFPHQRGIGCSGTEAVHPDIEGSVVDRRALGELADRSLGQSIDRTASLTDKGLIRTDHEDDSGLLIFHHGNHRFEGVKDTLQVDRENGFEFLKGGLLEIGKEVNSCIRKEGIDLSLPGHDPSNGRSHGNMVSDIAGNMKIPGTPIRLDIEIVDSGAAVPEEIHGRPTDPRASSGNHYHVIAEVHDAG